MKTDPEQTSGFDLSHFSNAQTVMDLRVLSSPSLSTWLQTLNMWILRFDYDVCITKIDFLLPCLHPLSRLTLQSFGSFFTPYAKRKVPGVIAILLNGCAGEIVTQLERVRSNCLTEIWYSADVHH